MLNGWNVGTLLDTGNYYYTLANARIIATKFELLTRIFECALYRLGSVTVVLAFTLGESDSEIFLMVYGYPISLFMWQEGKFSNL